MKKTSFTNWRLSSVINSGVAVYKVNASIELIFKFECKRQVNHFQQVKILLFYTGNMNQICRFVNYFLGHQHASGGMNLVEKQGMNCWVTLNGH